MRQGEDQWNAYGDEWKSSYSAGSEGDGVRSALGMWALFIIAGFLVCVGVVFLATMF